jgi:hypothetical protein
MCYVYQSAIQNIADASNGAEDTFTSRAIKEKFLADEWTMLEYHTGQLESRAWVLQERLLASATVYYGGREIRWICRTKEFRASDPKCPVDHPYAAENDRAIGQSMASMGGLTFTGNYGLRHIARFLAEDKMEHTAPENREISWSWRTLVVQYSKRELTFETDKLVALSGCAKLFGKAFGGAYLAGIWEHDIMNGLLWEAEEFAKRPSQYIAPS